MIKVVSFKICPFVQRVTAQLEAKGVPYELEFIQLQDKPDWFLEISPNGQVPVLITESGTPLFESDAIIEYLEETFGALEPDLSAEERAIDRAWSYQAAKNYLTQCATMRSADEKTLGERYKGFSSLFSKAEQIIGNGPFFKGKVLSKVDMAWLPLLHRASIIKQHTCFDFFANFPKVEHWAQALAETGLYEKSVSEDFEKVFTDFYLSDKTFLGKGEDCASAELDKVCQTGKCC